MVTPPHRAIATQRDDVVSGGASTSPSEFSRGWRVLLAAGLGITCGITAVPIYTIGAFVGPLGQENGWSRGAIQLAVVFCYLTLIFAGPFAGQLADRFGARRVALLSVLGLSAAVLSSLVLARTLPGLYAAYALIGILGAGTSPVVWTRAVSGWFQVNRGLALGVALMGTGVFATLGPKYVTTAIETCGWQCGYGALGVLPLFLVFPTALLWFHERSAAHVGAGAGAGAVVDGMDLQQAFRTRRFWIIAMTFLVFSTGISGFIANFIPMLTDTGLSPGAAASYAGFIGLAVMTGRIAAGALLDRVSTPVLSAVVMLLPTVGLMMGAAGLAPPVLLAVLIGFAGGAEFDLVAYMTARYFGLRHYGRLYGLLFSPIIAGAAFGPMLFGFGFERYGSYLPVLAACGVAFAFASVAQLALGDIRPLRRRS